eukprot:Tamp_16222.p3 GENE.Tamp_16222~~Tamp_16222.p3  ORF type:complete len:150 (+),score=37.92 Tamp_16222:435-884(+)
MRPDERACGSLSAPAGAEAGTQDAAGGELRRTCLTTPCRPRMDDAGAGAAVFGAVAPANAQIRAGAKRPTPKKLGSDRMPAQNFAPVITIFDHRGCARKGGEYKGELSGSQDDEMLVKVAQTQLKIDNPAFKELAASVLQASLTTLKRV